MRCLTFAAALVLLTALPLATQQPAAIGVSRARTDKVLLELAGNVSVLAANDLNDSTEYGGGLTIGVGYGFTPQLAGVVAVTPVILADFVGYMLTGDAGIRYHFSRPSRVVVPYVESAVSLIIAEHDDVRPREDPTSRLAVRFSGTGFTLGGGVLYFFDSTNPLWALSAGLKWTPVSFDDVRVSNAEDLSDGFVSAPDRRFETSTVRFSVGVKWFPMARR